MLLLLLTRSWSSCNYVGQMAVIKPIICGAILFKRGMIGKTFRMRQSINIQTPSVTAFKRYQREYLHSVIYHKLM